MHALAAFGVLSFTLCLLATPLCRNLFLRFGIVDHPDALRKLHQRSVPRIGGIPIVLAYAGALSLMLIFAPPWARLSVQHRALILELLPAAAIIFLTGLLDDLLTLKPWQKLSGQFIAAALVVSLGAPVSLSGLHTGSLWITILTSMLWLLGCTNAFNLIDGMDGLATGVGIFATVTISIVAILEGNLGLAMATAPLAGCLLGFLFFNFPPASVFLGDCGSLTLGFMLGCFTLIWSQHSGSLMGMTAPVMAISLPLIDVGLAITRRMLRNRPIFQGDRGHIHHMMLALGFKTRDATLILYGACALAAGLAVVQSFTKSQYRGFVLLIFFALVGIGVNYLGYIELTAVRRTISRRRLLGLLKEEIYIQDLSRSLMKVESVDECWSITRDACRDLGFASVRMSLNDQLFEETFFPHGDETHWTLTIGLGRTGYLTLVRAEQSHTPRNLIAVLEHLQQVTGEREEQFLQFSRQMSYPPPKPLL